MIKNKLIKNGWNFQKKFLNCKTKFEKNLDRLLNIYRQLWRGL